MRKCVPTYHVIKNLNLMVKLLIDGKSVNLSADLSFEFYDKNPLFTKEGRHTLDLDINLSDPVNANIYMNMYRIDVIRRPSGRSALLYDEHGVIIRGTEVILQIEDRKAKIQIVASNSELNYLSGGETHIKDLDLGEITNLNITTAWNSLYGSYPDWDYVCTPVISEPTFGVLPAMGLPGIYMNMVSLKEGTNRVEMVNGTTLSPQPYLAAMVRKVIEALGYTIESDFIESNNVLKKIILVNGYHTKAYNEMIPNWKVDDFLTEVEKFTGCIIISDQITKKVRIVQANSFYENAATETIDHGDIIGEIEKKFDEEVPEGMLYHNVEYKFPRTEIYNYWSVDKEFLDSLTIQQCDNQGTKVPMSRLFNFLADIWAALNGGEVPSHDCGFDVPDSAKDEYNKMIAYEDLGMDWNAYFVLRSVDSRVSHLRRLNYYGPRHDDASEESMELKIVPAEVVWSFPNTNNDGMDKVMYQQPILIARNSDSAQPISEGKGLNDFIAEGTSESHSDTLFAAFYMGFKDNNYAIDKEYQVLSPVAVPSNEVERFVTSLVPYFLRWGYWELMEIVKFGDAYCNMSINAPLGMYDQFWRNDLHVDFTRPYTVKFRNSKMRDSKNIFVIANKKFYCQELKYKVKSCKLSDMAEGTFYPIVTDEDTHYTGEDITIQVVINKTGGFVNLYADKTLQYPVVVQLAGTDGTKTYSAYIRMAAGLSQKSIRNSWVSLCSSFSTSLYSHDPADANNYIFTVNFLDQASE